MSATGSPRVTRPDSLGPSLPGVRGDLVDDILATVAAIPPGMAMTYGDIAAEVGHGGPRTVGKVLRWYGADVPWWRVVRADGTPPPGKAQRAHAHYEAEATPLRGGANAAIRVDLGRARYRPHQAG